jgi:hypothetical protein
MIHRDPEKRALNTAPDPRPLPNADAKKGSANKGINRFIISCTKFRLAIPPTAVPRLGGYASAAAGGLVDLPCGACP